jgi:hypothetical protein
VKREKRLLRFFWGESSTGTTTFFIPFVNIHDSKVLSFFPSREGAFGGMKLCWPRLRVHVMRSKVLLTMNKSDIYGQLANAYVLTLSTRIICGRDWKFIKHTKSDQPGGAYGLSLLSEQINA